MFYNVLQLYSRGHVFLQRVSGHPLKYTALVGKPSEITYRFSEHVLSKTAQRMGISRPLRKIYFFGYVSTAK